jgi:hypothetical protein
MAISGKYYSHNPYFLFTDVAVPVGATITSAYLVFVASAQSGNAYPTKVYANLATSPTMPADAAAAAAIYTSGLTTAYVDWTQTAAAGTKTSPDIATIIQEIVDQAAWASGNSILIVLAEAEVTSANNFQVVTGYDTTPADAAQLIISYDYDSTTTNDSELIVIGTIKPTHLTTGTDESDFPAWVRKYLEYGVIAAAYAANTDGRIPTLAEYWQKRKEVGYKALKLFKTKALADRNVQFNPAGNVRGRRRHPTLPDEYPET